MLKEKGFVIQNAGLVLLCPFFKPFFENNGLLQHGLFAGTASKFKAALLLQYFVSGTEQFDDASLLLNKICCGIPAGKTLPAASAFSEDEKKRSSELLLQAIGQWPSLKNCSPDSFREQFLARKGIINQTDRGWLLKVEVMSIDIILETIPWNFHLFKAEWMEEPIFTEWY